MPDDLAIDTSASAMDMANAIFGSGVNVVSASFTGATNSSGIYSGGLTTSPGVVPSDSGVILSTGNVNSFTTAGSDPNISSSTSTINGTAGYDGLTAIAGVQTYDAAVLTATFIPDGNTLTMQIVFSSEEYLEYVNSGFNDIVTVWVNGVPATLTIGSGDISIDNINDVSNSNLYVDNPDTLLAGDAYSTEMDGFTVTLTLKADVVAGAENTIVFAIADTGDAQLDSNLLIAGDSVQVALVAGDDTLALTKHGVGTFDLLANDQSLLGSTLTITEINGIPVQLGDTVTLPSGEVIVLNLDGTLSVTASVPVQNTVFSYTVVDDLGNSDVGFASITQMACFTTGTMIETPLGPRRVESLAVGDLVSTIDSGPQPIRWVGTAFRRATGTDSPVVIPPGRIGNRQAIVLSQQHRVLIEGPLLSLHCGLDQALVPAVHLAEAGLAELRTNGKPVLYHHIMLDRHEVLISNGVPSESFVPPQDLPDCEQAVEGLRLFGKADFQTRKKCALARPLLKKHEAIMVARLAFGQAGKTQAA